MSRVRIIGALVAALLVVAGCADPSGLQVSSSPPPLEPVRADVGRDETASVAYRKVRKKPYEWAESPALIAHGMGGIADKRVTNSLEAFEANYDRGYRIFETDLVLSTDGSLVARHDWLPYMYNFLGQSIDNPQRKLSEDEFKALPIHGQYTPLTIADIVELMKAYPDIYVMTDTKSTDPREVAEAMQVIRAAIGDDKMLTDRLIVQVYNEQMVPIVREEFGFQNLLYSLYQLKLGSAQDAITFAAKNGVKAVGVPVEMWTPALGTAAAETGLAIGVYTENDPVKAGRLVTEGADLIWSDFLSPAEVRLAPQP